VRALDAAGALEVRLLKKFTQRPLMSVWKGEDKADKSVLLTVVDTCGTPSERERILGAARALLPLAGTDGIEDVHRVMEEVDAFVSDFHGAGSASDLVVLRWPMTKKLDFVCRVADALIELHGAGVVHGCLCPDNILLDDDLLPILTEVGMVSIQESLEGDRENFFGYGAYAAPEVALGTVDVRSDVYSVGRLLTFVVLDKTPGSANVAAGGSTEAGVAAEELQDLRARSPNLATIVKKCIATPEGRYTSMAELSADLRRCRQLLVPESATTMRLSEPGAWKTQTMRTVEAPARPTKAPSRPTLAPAPVAATPRGRATADARRWAAPLWVSIASALLVGGVLVAVLGVTVRSNAEHLALQGLVMLGAVGLTLGFRATKEVRIALAVLAPAVVAAANPVDRVSVYDDDDAPTPRAAMRRRVLDAEEFARGGKDLHQAKLQLVDFSGLDLAGVDLEGADLTEANLKKTNLTGARVDGASFRAADLAGANLSNVTLDRAVGLEEATCDAATVFPAGWSCPPTHKVQRSP